MPGKKHRDDSFDGDVKLEITPKLDVPKMYRVIILNDHYTTMEFVVEVLVKIFHKQATEATMLMLDVHKKGKGICGVYTYDVAMTKINAVHSMAKERGFPLKCSYEEA